MFETRAIALDGLRLLLSVYEAEPDEDEEYYESGNRQGFKYYAYKAVSEAYFKTLEPRHCAFIGPYGYQFEDALGGVVPRFDTRASELKELTHLERTNYALNPHLNGFQNPESIQLLWLEDPQHLRIGAEHLRVIREYYPQLTTLMIVDREFIDQSDSVFAYGGLTPQDSLLLRFDRTRFKE